MHNFSTCPLLLWMFMQHQPKCWESFWLSQSPPFQHFTVEVTHTELPLATAFRGSKFNTLIYSILSGRLCGNEAPHHSVFKKKKSLPREIMTHRYLLTPATFPLNFQPYFSQASRCVYCHCLSSWPEKNDMENFIWKWFLFNYNTNYNLVLQWFPFNLQAQKMIK